MLYIIEGLDGTGKTALARALQESQGWPVLKLGAANSRNSYADDMAAAHALSACYSECEMMTLICDRGILSGLAHSDLPLDEARKVWLEWRAITAAIPVTIVHLLAPSATREQRDGVGYIHHSPRYNLDSLIDWFVAESELEGMPITRYRFDTGVLRVDTIIKALLELRYPGAATALDEKIDALPAEPEVEEDQVKAMDEPEVAEQADNSPFAAPYASSAPSNWRAGIERHGKIIQTLKMDYRSDGGVSFTAIHHPDDSIYKWGVIWSKIRGKFGLLDSNQIVFNNVVILPSSVVEKFKRENKGGVSGICEVIRAEYKTHGEIQPTII